MDDVVSLDDTEDRAPDVGPETRDLPPDETDSRVGSAEPVESTRAPARLRRISDIVWRSAVVAAGIGVLLAALWYLRIVTLPLFIAALLSTALVEPVAWLERRGWRSWLATLTVFASFLLIIVGVFSLIVPATIGELDGVGTAVSAGIDDVANWLVDGPLNLDRSAVTDWTDDPVGRLTDLFDRSQMSITSGARTVGEILVGVVLTLVLLFFFLKDGRRFQRSALRRVPSQHAELTRAVARSSWGALGGFLRGAALLGVVEGTIIGLTLQLVGAPLALPIGVLTFIGAFFPIVGAVVSGLVAGLVALASGGLSAAVIVGIVAVVVQQLDSDLLAPFIYGKQLQLHPVAILVALTAGGYLGGIAGAFVAVPTLAVLSGAAQELWTHRDALDPEPQAPPRSEWIRQRLTRRPKASAARGPGASD